MRHEPIVQSQFKLSDLESREADFHQHFLQFLHRYPRLMLIESQFVVNHFYAGQNFQNGIDGGAWPGHDQAALRPQDSISFGKHLGGCARCSKTASMVTWSK
jgi:hypothetical protein